MSLPVNITLLVDRARTLRCGVVLIGWGGAPDVVRASFRVMIATVAHSTIASWRSGRGS
jgi:hypothetical protein